MLVWQLFFLVSGTEPLKPERRKQSEATCASGHTLYLKQQKKCDDSNPFLTCFQATHYLFLDRRMQNNSTVMSADTMTHLSPPAAALTLVVR